MFIVDDNPRFTHTVEAMVPIDGGHEKQDFKVTYQAVDTDKFEYDLNTPEGSNAFLRAVVVGLDDLIDRAGKRVPYSDKVRDQVISKIWARKAIVRGYFDAVGKSAEGN